MKFRHYLPSKRLKYVLNYIYIYNIYTPLKQKIKWHMKINKSCVTLLYFVPTVGVEPTPPAFQAGACHRVSFEGIVLYTCIICQNFIVVNR